MRLAAQVEGWLCRDLVAPTAAALVAVATLPASAATAQRARRNMFCDTAETMLLTFSLRCRCYQLAALPALPKLSTAKCGATSVAAYRCSCIIPTRRGCDRTKRTTELGQRLAAVGTPRGILQASCANCQKRLGRHSNTASFPSAKTHTHAASALATKGQEAAKSLPC